MARHQEVMVALSESVMKSRVKSPLVEKSRWRHFQLVIKLHYLGNHASQIRSYYGTLSWSHSHSFRIRHEKVRTAPPGGGRTMTSYPVGNKTSLYREPCIADKKLLWITIRKTWSLYQNLSWKIAWSLVSFSRVVQIKKKRTPNLSKTSVSAGSLISNNLPMQRLQSYCSFCAHGCSLQLRYCDMHILQLLKVIGMTLEHTLLKLSVL